MKRNDDPMVSEPTFDEVGHAGIDRDHDALAMILDQAERICNNAPASASAGCNMCSREQHGLCSALLDDVGTRLITSMLDHFSHEDALMATLPKTPEVRTHCGIHRAEHVKFSTRYNRIVANFEPRNVVASAKMLEEFIIEWIRKHVLEYDSILSRLLNTGKSITEIR